MKLKTIFITLLFAVIFQPCNGNHSDALAKCFIFPTDTIVFNDTLQLNDTLAIVKHRLMITDTFINRIVIDNTWLNKTSSITDYIITPNDTITRPARFHQSSIKSIKKPKIAKNRAAKKKNNKASKDSFLVETKEKQTCDECEEERLAAIAAEKKEEESKNRLATYTRKASPVKETANVEQKYIAKLDSIEENIKIEVINNVVIGRKIKPNPNEKNLEVTFINIDQPLLADVNENGAAVYPVKTISDLEGSSHISTRQISVEEAYSMTLRDINTERLSIAEQYRRAKNQAQKTQVLDKAANYLSGVVANEVTYYWYGQRFDTEKTLQKLGKDIMPDNYFVVSMLTEVGLKTDRRQLLQKNAASIVRNLSQETKRYNSLEEIKQLTQTKGTGLYLIAFNSHLAFLFNDGLAVYVIHALPQPLHTVTRLSIDDAHFLAEATHYDIGKLSDNKELIKKWLKGEIHF
ncbi:MAG: hypothetical protein ACPG5B_02365 [Chitinophagales bacterium]